MDYEDLLQLHVEESAASGRQRYRPVKSLMDISPAGRDEFEKAKNLLSVVSPKSNLSLYDHLGAILRKVLRFGITNAVDNLEDISLSLKNEKQSEESDIIEISPPNEVLLKFIEEKKRFYKLKPVISREAIKTAEDEEEIDEDEDKDEDEDENEDERVAEEQEDTEEDDESAIDVATVLPDLLYNMQRFSLVGVGLSPLEVHDLHLAMKELAKTHKLEEVRLWGKVFANTCSYYVVESKYREEVTPEDFGWQPIKIEASEEVDDEEVSNEEESSEAVEETDDVEETDEVEDTTLTSSTPKIPPIPQTKIKKKKSIPAEEGGTGINERLYFVATQIDQPWRCLPLLMPFHITGARRIKRFFTGNLEAEIGGGVPFPGKEAHYLRAQIARITASITVSPTDYYQISDEDADEDNPSGISKNDSYESKSVLEMFSNGLEAWVHCKPAILHQGRCSPMEEGNDEEDQEEEEEEDDDDEDKDDDEESEIFEAKKEVEVPLLRSISEDKAIGNLIPWNIKLSSKLAKELSILFLQSNLWPGGFTFYDGKTFDNIYIGFGYKYSTYHYAPIIPITFQKEYEAGSDILEPEDSEVEEPEPEPEPESVEGDTEAEENESKEDDEEAEEGSDEGVEEGSDDEDED